MVAFCDRRRGAHSLSRFCALARSARRTLPVPAAVFGRGGSLRVQVEESRRLLLRSSAPSVCIVACLQPSALLALQLSSTRVGEGRGGGIRAFALLGV